MSEVKKRFEQALGAMGVSLESHVGTQLTVCSPIDGCEITSLSLHNKSAIESSILDAHAAFEQWRLVPAPRRGELIRIFGEVLREHKQSLGELVTIECGKILSEGLGEVQEMIDICDFAVGLSRQLYGLEIKSERPEHNMVEHWQPLGVVGVISAFNFPVAVWAWNTAIAVVCGNSVVWKPSEKTPVTAIVCQHLFEEACKNFDENVPKGLAGLIIGEREAGEALVTHKHVQLVSATGSTRMGKAVGPAVAQRFGKCLLELGGNNALVVAPSSDLEVAMPSIVFGAVGTAGQRCTSTRRLFVHDSVYDKVLSAIKVAYASICESKIGDPLDANTLVGPLIDGASKEAMMSALEAAKEQGGEVYFGEEVERDGAYMQPAIVEMTGQTDVVKQETFAPIVYIMKYNNLDEVIDVINEADQGLSAAIMTTDLREAEQFKRDVVCGIVNVNIGTSGAEIGGAFGGEKETGGGRESGSDAWKQYMRRVTSTTYFGAKAPALAQGVEFNL